MRICILTQPLEKNYGGILQAYALQKVLAAMGHEVTTLRFKPLYAQASSRIGFYWKIFRRFLSKLKGNKGIRHSNPDRQWAQYRQVNRVLEEFIEKQLHCLEADIPLDSRKLPPFDAFIVGSDQVWRPVFSPCLTDFYLGFLRDDRPLRIAYAASFGVDEWESSEEQTAVLRKLAQRFDRISVREASGVALCKDHLGVEAELMPDPTLLLTREDYLGLCQDGSYGLPDQPYVATYFIDPNPRKEELVAAFAEQHHLPVVPLGRFNWDSGSDSMEKWLTGLAGAEYIVTDSFHGTVFSLIFRKDFISFVNWWRGSSRFHTLLEAFDLQDRLVDPDSISAFDISQTDKEAFARKLSLQREKGLTYLSEALAANKR
ncbi:MAG: polysaccharide pyruvyl transferase family protein [Bacteroidales bacterium]|nr:polysaccharide pyruvyl transferase family protein [Bacteroidales bacterium]